MQAAFCSSTHFVLGVSCVCSSFSLGFVLVLFQFLPCFFLVLALPHYVFLRVWATISQLFKTLFSHTAGRSSVGIHPAAFRGTVSSGSLGKGRSCQYFMIKLLQWKTQTCGALFWKGRGANRFFFTVTGTGPKTIVAGFFFFSEVKFRAGFLFFPHIAV